MTIVGVIFMSNRCATLIQDILYGQHKMREWQSIKHEFDQFIATATDEEIREIEESGAGDTIEMIAPTL